MEWSVWLTLGLVSILCLVTLAGVVFAVWNWMETRAKTRLPSDEDIRKAAAGVYQIHMHSPNVDINLDKTLSAQIGGIRKYLNVDQQTATTIAEAASAQKFSLLPGDANQHAGSGVHGTYILATDMDGQIHVLNNQGVLEKLRDDQTNDTIKLTGAGAMVSLVRDCNAFNKLVHVNGDGSISMNDYIPFTFQDASKTNPTTAKRVLGVGAPQRCDSKGLTTKLGSNGTILLHVMAPAADCTLPSVPYYLTASWSDDAFHNGITHVTEKDKKNSTSNKNHFKCMVPISFTTEECKALTFTVTQNVVYPCNGNTPITVFMISTIDNNGDTLALTVAGVIENVTDASDGLSYTTDASRVSDSKFGPILGLALTKSSNPQFQPYLSTEQLFQSFEYVDYLIQWRDWKQNELWGGITWNVTTNNLASLPNPDFVTVPVPEDITSSTRAQFKDGGIFMWPMVTFDVQVNL